jgi:hypothetical protein
MLALIRRSAAGGSCCGPWRVGDVACRDRQRVPGADDDGYGQLISLLNQANDATITSDGARVTYNGATFDADLYFVDYFKVPAGSRRSLWCGRRQRSR